MTTLAQRLPMLVDIRNEGRQVVRENAHNSIKDKNGVCSAMLALDLRFFAVADYVLNRNVESFRSQLAESAQIRLALFDRFIHGEPIDASYVTMLSYKSLFDALAAERHDIAQSLASRMGRRDDLEQEQDHPFDSAMGYTLRAFILRDHEQMHIQTTNFSQLCNSVENADFRGYSEIFSSLLEMDNELANKGLKNIVKGHKKQAKGRGVFANTESELLCLWGIGIANLAQFQGINLSPIPPLIPDDLI